MLSLLLVLAALSVAGLLMLVRAVFSAPEGYEDADGFHAVRSGEPVETRTPSEVSVGLNDLLYLDERVATQSWH